MSIREKYKSAIACDVDTPYKKLDNFTRLKVATCDLIVRRFWWAIALEENFAIYWMYL